MYEKLSHNEYELGNLTENDEIFIRDIKEILEAIMDISYQLKYF